VRTPPGTERPWRTTSLRVTGADVGIVFERTFDGAFPWISRPGSRRRSSVPVPVDCSYMSGARDRLAYASAQQRGAHEWAATCTWGRHGLQPRIEDTWREGDEGVALTRRLRTTGLEADDATGVRLQLTLPTADEDALRFCCPGMVYSEHGRQ
jgi:hypothetical protein